jgi:hypothetical protein
MARKLTAGPTPDGGFISRRTDNDYGFAVAVFDTTERRYSPSNKLADERGYIENPTLDTWVSFSWHGRYDLAAKSVDKARGFGYRAVIVPVVTD